MNETLCERRTLLRTPGLWKLRLRRYFFEVDCGVLQRGVTELGEAVALSKVKHPAAIFHGHAFGDGVCARITQLADKESCRRLEQSLQLVFQDPTCARVKPL